MCVLCNHTAFSKQTTLSWSTLSAVFSCPCWVQVILSGHSGNRAHCGIVYCIVSSKYMTDIHGCSKHYEWVVQFCYVELEYMPLRYEEFAVIMQCKWQYRKMRTQQYTQKEFLPNFQNNYAKCWRVKILNVIGIISQKDNVNNNAKSQSDATIILLLLHLVGFLYYCINDAQSHKHQTLLTLGSSNFLTSVWNFGLMNAGSGTQTTSKLPNFY